jgi:hypothetical protein
VKPLDELRTDLLADSRATLRQVGAVVQELDGAGAEDSAEGPAAMVRTLLGAYAEVLAVIDGLRRSRSSLNDATLQRLQVTNAKLDEVSFTTEVAASDMLDDLDQAVSLLDRLDEGSADEAEEAEIRSALREHLDHVVSLLQFQDITSQQLGYASGVLSDVERRLGAVASALAQAGGVDGAPEEAAPPERPSEEPGHPTCDPNASTDGSEDRQALADEIFG